jgi:hypothetical protein
MWKPEATDGCTELVGVKVVEQVCDCANAGKKKLIIKTALTGFMVGCYRGNSEIQEDRDRRKRIVEGKELLFTSFAMFTTNSDEGGTGFMRARSSLSR